MKSRKFHLVVVGLLFAAIFPSRAFSQSQTPNDETQQLRKLVEQMQAKMSTMQSEIDQLKGTKPETPPPSQPSVVPGISPPQKEAYQPSRKISARGNNFPAGGTRDEAIPAVL